MYTVPRAHIARTPNETITLQDGNYINIEIPHDTHLLDDINSV